MNGHEPALHGTTRRAPTAAAATLSLTTAALFALLLAALHLLRPELDPSWHLISEYALGELGWMMVLAFAALAVSCVALALALWGETPTTAGRIGLVLLVVTAFGLALAAIFPTDPLSAPPEARTPGGKLHELGATLDLVPLAAALVSWSLVRRNPSWAAAARALAWTTVACWAAELLFVGVLAATLPDDGRFGPGVPVGWPNRLVLLAQCVWLMTAAGWARSLRALRHSASGCAACPRT